MITKQTKFIIINFILCYFVSFSVSGQKFKKKQFRLKASVAAMYDDNILKYSDKYIDRFLNNEDEGRFDIKTYDDVFLKSKLSTSYYFKFFKKKKTTVSATYINNSYINNPVKTWNYYGIGIKQQFAKKATVKFAYSYIPAFYVRQFRQEDLVDLYGYEPNTFKAYVFAKDNYSLNIQNVFSKKTKVSANFSIANYFHNSYYTEYDSNNLATGIQIEQSVSKKIKLSIGYMYTNSDAKGYDEEGETKETSDESDASYVDHAFSLGVKAKLPSIFKKKTNIALKVKYANRFFSSAHLIQQDPLHVDRTDKNVRINLVYNVKLSKKAGISLYYNYLYRDSYNNQGIYDAVVSEDKDYKQNQIGLQYAYSFY